MRQRKHVIKLKVLWDSWQDLLKLGHERGRGTTDFFEMVQIFSQHKQNYVKEYVFYAPIYLLPGISEIYNGSYVSVDINS